MNERGTSFPLHVRRTGIEMIADERARQLNIGRSEEHDQAHDRGELGYAAACYATPPWARHTEDTIDLWPWPDEIPERLRETARDAKFSLRDDPAELRARRDELAKAGALCAAEIDRLNTLIEET